MSAELRLSAVGEVHAAARHLPCKAAKWTNLQNWCQYDTLMQSLKNGLKRLTSFPGPRDFETLVYPSFALPSLVSVQARSHMQAQLDTIVYLHYINQAARFGTLRRNLTALQLTRLTASWSKAFMCLRAWSLCLTTGMRTVPVAVKQVL